MNVDETPIENMTPAQIENAMRQLDTLRKMKLPSLARQTINAAEYKRFESAVKAFLARQINADGEVVTKSCAAGQHKAEPYFAGTLRCKVCGRVKVL